MNTSTAKKTRGEFYTAIHAAIRTIKAYPKTHIAYWCNRFVILNKKVTEKHEKAEEKLLRNYRNEYRDFKINNSLLKDGVFVVKKDPTNPAMLSQTEYDYEPASPSAAIAIANKLQEVNDKMDPIIETFLDEEVEVRIFLDKVELPKDFENNLFNSLNGFVFHNESEFAQELNDISDNVETVAAP